MSSSVLTQVDQRNSPSKPSKWASRLPALHLYLGLTAAFFVVVLGLTGALLAFQDPIDRAFNPHLSYVVPAERQLPLETLIERVKASYPGYVVSGVGFPERPEFSISFGIHRPGSREGTGVAVNQYTGEVLGDFDHSNHFMDRVRDLHANLLLGSPGEAAMWFVGLFLVVLSISGLLMWRKRKRYWTRPGTRPAVSALDLHSAIGVYACLFVFLFGITAMRPVPVGLVSKLPWMQPGFKVAPQPGAPIISTEEFLRTAKSSMPNARVEWLELPRPEGGGPVAVLMRYPEDHSRIPRSAVFVNPYTGAVVAVQNSRKLNVLAKYAWLWNWEIHTGSLFGLPTQILMSGMSLVLAALAITGTLLWWRRRTL